MSIPDFVGKKVFVIKYNYNRATGDHDASDTEGPFEVIAQFKNADGYTQLLLKNGLRYKYAGLDDIEDPTPLTTALSENNGN